MISEEEVLISLLFHLHKLTDHISPILPAKEPLRERRSTSRKGN